jgi:hypothetical protein
MKLRKSRMRDCAREALRMRGYDVDVVSGGGIVPGARLKIFKGSEARSVAVRTSLDREVGLTRHPDGTWMTVTKVDEVIVVVPSAHDPGSADVFSFSPATMMEAFDQELAAHQKRKPELSYKAPIFVALDDRRRGRTDIIVGLKAKAQWHTTIPLASVAGSESSSSAAPSGFVERARLEFAQLNGVDVSRVMVEKVTVEFRICQKVQGTTDPLLGPDNGVRGGRAEG